jgi:hypothetical protein
VGRLGLLCFAALPAISFEACYIILELPLFSQLTLLHYKACTAELFIVDFVKIVPAMFQ